MGMGDFSMTIAANGLVTLTFAGSSPSMAYLPWNRLTTFPTPPRVPISNAAFAGYLSNFTALVASGSFDKAIGIVRDNGFTLAVADVAGGSLTAFKAFVVQRVMRHEDSGLADGFWS